MGYYTSYSDEITIDPPLSWEELQRLPEHSQDFDDWEWSRDVKLDVQEERVNTSEGVLIKRTARAIQPSQEDSYKGYDIITHVQEIVDEVGEGHRFGGYIYAEGEDTGDIWRLYVINGRAQSIKPEIVWPEIVEPAITWPEV